MVREYIVSVNLGKKFLLDWIVFLDNETSVGEREWSVEFEESWCGGYLASWNS